MNGKSYRSVLLLYEPRSSRSVNVTVNAEGQDSSFDCLDPLLRPLIGYSVAVLAVSTALTTASTRVL